MHSTSDQQPADQEFQREIVDALAALGVAGALDGQPAMDDAVADRRVRPPRNQSRSVAEPASFPTASDQLGEHRALDFDQRLLTRSRTALQQGVARHVSKLASRARIIHYLVLQGVVFPHEIPCCRPPIPPAHCEAVAAWSRCKGYAGLPGISHPPGEPVGILALRQPVNRDRSGGRTGSACASRPGPWIVGAEGPHVALGILAGVVAPAVVLRLRLGVTDECSGEPAAGDLESARRRTNDDGSREPASTPKPACPHSDFSRPCWHLAYRIFPAPRSCVPPPGIGTAGRGCLGVPFLRRSP